MLVFADLETTGLDPATCVVLEVGLTITDKDLRVLAEQAWVLGVSEQDKAAAEEVVQKMHDSSGLWAECLASSLSERDVEAAAIEFLKAHDVPPGKIPLAGNTIGFDRSFLREYMEDLLDYFHYRSVDVSTLGELARLWYPDAFEGRPQGKPHRALADIQGSITQLKHYRSTILRPMSNFP